MSQWTRSYTRKSRALGDADDPELLAHHRSDLRRLSERDGRPLSPSEMREEVGSGETIAARPVFAALLREIEALDRGGSGLLFCLSVSRLTRDSHADAGRIINALSRAGIIIHTPNKRYDLRLAEDIFLFDLETVFAHREFREAKERLQRGQLAARREGKIPNGSHPFGYRYTREEKTLVVDPDRFPILAACCRRAVLEPVWRLAIEYGVPETCLLRALRNPTICGFPARHYGPRDPEQPHRKDYVPIPREQWLWPEKQNMTYPHACTRTEWETLQMALDERREQRARRHQGEGWCRDRVQFQCSPGPVRLGSYAVTRTKTGNVMCLVYERALPLGMSRPFIPRETVHKAVLPPLAARLTDPRLLARCRSLTEAGASTALDEREEERLSVRRRLAQNRQRYQETLDAEMDAEDVNHRQALSVRRLRLQERLASLEKDLQRLESKEEERELARLLQFMPQITEAGFREWWTDVDGFKKRALVNACVSRIEVVIEPTRPPRPHRREVSDLQWQEWLNLS